MLAELKKEQNKSMYILLEGSVPNNGMRHTERVLREGRILDYSIFPDLSSGNRPHSLGPSEKIS